MSENSCGVNLRAKLEAAVLYKPVVALAGISARKENLEEVVIGHGQVSEALQRSRHV
jgi:hypothetical protein